jgi:hypothetical protein
VVSKAGVGSYHGRRPPLGLTKTELVLTSQNIVVVSVNMVGKQTGHRFFPLEHVRVIDGRPQVFAQGGFGTYLLEVHFQNGQESFGFASKGELETWAENLTKLLTRRSDEITTAAVVSPGPASVGDQIKDVASQVTSLFRPSGKGPAAATPARTARRCSSCSAPIAGIAGRVVRCEYCQSDQQL